MSSSSPLTHDDLSQRLTLILNLLCGTVAARAGRHRAVAPLVLLLWPYLRRLATRFERLTRPGRARPGRAHPGRAHPGRRPPAAAPSASTAVTCHRPARPRPLPGGFAWLVRLAPETAVFGSQLRHLLTAPEMAALLAELPQAGRILRPLCRMLGVGPEPGLPPALFPPPKPLSRPETPRPETPRPETPRPETPRSAAPGPVPRPAPSEAPTQPRPPPWLALRRPAPA